MNRASGFELFKRFKEGRESVRDDERWPRWASRQFLSLPIAQILLPLTFGYSIGCGYETIEEMKEAVTKIIDTLTQEDFHGAVQKLLERYNKCIAAGGDYFERD